MPPTLALVLELQKELQDTERQASVALGLAWLCMTDPPGRDTDSLVEGSGNGLHAFLAHRERFWDILSYCVL